MNISLTSELENFVKAQVASGQYSSASEVIREALREHIRSVKQRDFEQRLELSRKAWSAGDVTEADEAYFDGKIERLRSRHGL